VAEVAVAAFPVILIDYVLTAVLLPVLLEGRVVTKVILQPEPQVAKL